MELSDAVDGLQAAASAYGLVAALGQDAVQSILSETFRPYRTDLAQALCRQDAAMAGGKLAGVVDQARKTESPQTEPSEGAAESTVEALMYALRTNGCAALATNRGRLAELSDRQVREVIVRLRRIQSDYPSITDELLELLVELLS